MITLGPLDYLDDKRILITGGTGSLGKKLTKIIQAHVPLAQIIICSRDEFKQYEMRQLYAPEEQKRLRFFLGDVRDEARLNRAMEGVDYVVHAAALKQVPAAEYNPFEFVKTNVVGLRT
jgi:UDP-N-acetylglucosamine 4,6-dehydratase